MYSNEIFSMLAEKQKEKKPSRLKGYYFCPDHGDYVKNIATPYGHCPFCGFRSKKLMDLSNIDYEMVKELWRESGYYSDERAGIKKMEVAYEG